MEFQMKKKKMNKGGFDGTATETQARSFATLSLCTRRLCVQLHVEAAGREAASPLLAARAAKAA
jgi:hypothetical protein